MCCRNLVSNFVLNLVDTASSRQCLGNVFLQKGSGTGWHPSLQEQKSSANGGGSRRAEFHPLADLSAEASAKAVASGQAGEALFENWIVFESRTRGARPSELWLRLGRVVFMPAV